MPINQHSQGHLLPSSYWRIPQGMSFLHGAQQRPSLQVTGCVSRGGIRAQATLCFFRATRGSLAQGSDCPPHTSWLFFRSRHLKKMTEEYPTLPQGAEASLPLTGSVSCGIPSILRKMWVRHKKKAEYVGATNSAFEAD